MNILKVLKTERSKHCDICNKCISVYDHHCPWINNCVGSNNYFLFYYFLISMLLEMTFMIALHTMSKFSNFILRPRKHFPYNKTPPGGGFYKRKILFAVPLNLFSNMHNHMFCIYHAFDVLFNLIKQNFVHRLDTKHGPRIDHS